MANYCCTLRTNCFHVKNEKEFSDLMDSVYGEYEIDVWEDRDADNVPVFAFGSYGMIAGVMSDPDDSPNDFEYDEFIEGLQRCVADDDAIIMLESGNEKLRYVAGIASVITSKDYVVIDLNDEAKKIARKLLKNPDWHGGT